jgi:N-acetylglucosamine kinase-like BadF-type ATPase
MRLLLGVDGGWSTTRGALSGVDGEGLVTLEGPGTVMMGEPGPATLETLAELVRGLLAKAGAKLADVAHLALGVHGVDFEEERPAQQQAVADSLGCKPERLTLVNDALVALWGASPAEKLALVQHGSGFTSAWRAKLGGEQVFDSLDAGQVFDLRRAAFSLTARMIDGRAPPTPLKDAILAHCAVPEDEFCVWAVREAAFAALKMMELPPVIFEAWRAGDAAAESLVDLAAEDYAVTAAAVRKLTGAPLEAAFGGGVIAEGGRPLQRRIAEHLADLAPDIRPIPVALPPVLGALALAAFQSGHDPAALFETLPAAEQAPAMAGE